MTSLEGRVAIVTGAAGGAGRAVSSDLAGAGARLALLGTHLDHLEALAAELELPADGWFGRAVDVRDATAMREAADAVIARFGRIDILVHLIGGWTGGTPVVETGDHEFQAMLDQHLWTTLNAVRAVVPPMTAAGWGRIVAVSSPVASSPPPKLAAYAVGKAAEETLLATLAREVAGTGVTVNVVLVRSIEAGREDDGVSTSGGGRGTAPWEIAAAVRYLCSEDAAAVNGARIQLFGAR